MAKKRRASLKDKDPETLGITQKKSKGIDLLFGETGPDATMEDSMGNEETSTSPNFVDDDMSGIMSFDERSRDELGLPVALEAPPDDLILASAQAGAMPDTSEADPVVLSTSPFALPVLESAGANIKDNAADLSGILEEENLPTEEEPTLVTAEKETDLSGLVEQERAAPAAVEEDDLSGLAQEATLAGARQPGSTATLPPPDGVSASAAATDLSDLAMETESIPPAEDAADLSGLAEEDDLSGLDATTPLTPLPTTAAPIQQPAPTFQPTYPSTMPSMSGVPGYTAQPMPYSTSTPPPSTATGAASMSPPRSNIELEGLHQNVAYALSALGQAMPDSPQGFLPADALPDNSGVLTVQKYEQVARDEAITKQVLEYIGPKRRDRLFEEIHELHYQVPEKLSNNKEDVNFALKTLQEANNFVIEDPRQYDEALYRVAIVRAMLARKSKLNFWSYRMGLLILFYGLLWTVGCIAGVFATIDFTKLLRGDVLGQVFEAVYFSALAGGLGGSVEILWRLYYRVSIRQDFDPQYTMYYLVKPILGLVLGMIMYFLVAIASSFGGTSSLPGASASTGFILAIVLGFIAGYRQESVFDMIYVLMKRIAPAVDKDKTSTKSMIPLPDEADGTAKPEIK